MSAPGPVRALLFDLDGTLVDTERQTDIAIAAVAARYGVEGFSLPPALTRGIRWNDVAVTIRARASLTVASEVLATELVADWTAAASGASEIPGASEALRAAAHSGLRLAVVSSSPRALIDYFIDRLGVSAYVVPKARISAESVRIGKPDPEGFLLAARALGAAPHECLVFEDSRAGLLAARAAGMHSIFITCCADEIVEKHALASAMLTDYQRLPTGFWGDLVLGRADFIGKTFD